MIVWIVGSVGPGASPTPTIPSSVWIRTSRPDAECLVPPGHTNGSRMDVRTAIVSILAILTERGRDTARDRQIRIDFEIVDMTIPTDPPT